MADSDSGATTNTNDNNDNKSSSSNAFGMLLENFMKSQQNSLKNLFLRGRSDAGDVIVSPKTLHFLSPIANSVVYRCSKVLEISVEGLRHRFDFELPEDVRQPSVYARNFVEFCSFEVLCKMTKHPDYLSDKDFRRLIFDMMLAWEDPSPLNEEQKNESPSCHEAEEGDGWSLFYSNSTKMAVQVDGEKTVGPEAFARIAPSCAVIADVITVSNLFNALTSSSCNRLHFLLYDKYLRSLDKVIKASKNASSPTMTNFVLAEGEIVLDIDGAVPTQPVLQHIGLSAWPGRLTLTNYALYFEALGVGTYDKAVRYDLAADQKQVIKPELTGPLGARLFDKAVMYKSTSVAEPVFMEFPEFKGHSRRDYWLDICLEILYVHKFVRKYNFKESQQSEILARAILGILRCRAIREALRIFSSNYKTLLAFNLAESLPRGDIILETLASRLMLLHSGSSLNDEVGSPYAKGKKSLPPASLLALCQLGFALQKPTNLNGEAFFLGDVLVGEINPLEVAVKRSLLNTGHAEAAQATVDQVKVEGIDTNFGLMKELLYPVTQLADHLQRLASWEEPFKSVMFVLLGCYMIYRGWVRYLLPSIFIFFAVIMLYRRYLYQRNPPEAFRVTLPPTRNALEQLITLQEAVSQVEALIQSGNIILLKIRALLLAVLPQATDRVALLLVLLAAIFAFVPMRYMLFAVFLEVFSREMPLRRESSERALRRLREWWIRIPAAPVQLIKAEDKKNK